MDQMIGKHIDTYQIQEVLGRGGMGVVYKGIDTSLERDVAIKMMDVMIAQDPNFLKRFQSEARALAKLQNPNIVTVFALRETEFGVCIVMEFVKGKTLADLLKASQLVPIPRVVNIFKQVCSALDHAHRENVIHRDIKPGNIMLADGDVVKVTDFGLAKIQKNAVSTMTMGTAGTLYYMSPEQIRGLGNVDNRGDIYSAGMALYESLTGRVPFNPEDPDFVIAQSIVEGKITAVDKMNPSVPKELAKIVMKSIDKDPAKRYQTAAEMAQALERFGSTLKPGDYAVSQAATIVGMPSPLPMPKKITRQIVQKTGGNKGIVISVAAAVVLAITYFILRPMLFPEDGRITVRTQPGGARIFMDNSLVATPAGEEFAAPTGVRKISATWGPDRLDTTVTVEGGKHLVLTLALKKPSTAVRTQAETPAQGGGQVEQGGGGRESVAPPVDTYAMGTIIVDPVGSGEVSIDGGGFVSVPGKAIPVPAGSRTLVFRKGGLTGERTVYVGNGRTETVRCYFEAEVNIQSTKEDDKAWWGTIVVDGVKREEVTPKTITLSAGIHRIGVERSGYAMADGVKEIRIRPSFEKLQPIRVAIKLKKQ
jgi:predicted Ser/Thr protein kinase